MFLAERYERPPATKTKHSALSPRAALEKIA
jgi:hypothetical protein